MSTNDSTYCDLNDEYVLLAYVEDLLDPQQRVLVEQHLLQCGHCVEEVHGLREVILALKDHRDAFCPEPWEIYEFVRHRRDPQNRISRHLNQCPSDQTMARLLEKENESMPEDLWDKIRGMTRPEETETWLSRLAEWFRRPWGMPAFGAAAVATAVLVLVVVMPKETYRPVVALSMVSWDEVPKPKTTKRPSVTILLAFEGITPEPNQDEIDALYKAISPNMDLYERYCLIPPSEVKQAQEDRQVSLKTRKALLEGLDKKLAVAKAVFVTFRPAEQGALAKLELIACASGIVLADRTETGSSPSEIAGNIGESLQRLLDQTGTQPQNTGN